MLKTTNFITKANISHGEKYDYSIINYVNNYTKVKIICPIHAVFEQTPNAHLNGSGCPNCDVERRRSTTEQFIIRAKSIQGYKYDYSLVEYKNDVTKIKINCHEHGMFEQTPNNHLSGNGCPKCGRLKSIKNRTKTKEDVITSFIKLNGLLYDYSKVEYINNKSKVKILCKKHGMFEQTPSNHLKGRGCPFCTESNGERLVRVYLEKNKISYIRQHFFDNCVNPKTGFKLKFDFYLPDYNTCVEYDGQQHYFQQNYFGGKEKFIDTQHKDLLKDKYCDENNIELIRIKYNESVVNTLTNKLLTYVC